MNEEYYPEIHEKIYPEEVEYGRFRVYADVKRKGKTAKLEKVDNPSIVYYSQFDSMYVNADFHNIIIGNYILTVTGEDRKEYVTVFPLPNHSSYEW